jgi:hypothetical protein
LLTQSQPSWDSTPPPRKKSNTTLFLAILVIIVAVVAVDAGIYVSELIANRNTGKQQVVNLVNGVVTLQAGGYQPFQMNIPPTSNFRHVLGNFNASSGNDVLVFVMDDRNFGYWRNGQSFMSVYYSLQVSYGYISASLGTSNVYYLVYNNPSSAGPAKNIQTEADLYYTT